MKREKGIDYARLQDLTVDEVKAVPLFQHLTDREAERVIETLKIFTKITYDNYKKSSENDENATKNK